MARDRGPPVMRQPLPRLAVSGEPRAWGWGWWGAGPGPWPGLVPGLVLGLLAALLAWLWYGRAERSAEAAPGHRRARGEQEAAGGPVESDGQVPSDALPSPRKTEDPVDVPKEELNHVPSGKPLQMEPLLPKQGGTDAMEHLDHPDSSQAAEWRPQMGQASDGWCMMNLAGASDGGCKDENEEQQGQPAESRDWDRDHDEWEVVSEHQAWGETVKKGSMEDSDSKEWEQGDCSDGELKAKRVAAVPPMLQNIQVTFRVHYFTHTDAQLLGVTGDHECLGQWHSYVPLKYDKDGFWSESISLPADSRMEWKFILVENGKVRRWEECANRTLVTDHEDQTVHQWWGYH